jgi:hypothetical protein
MQQAKTFGGKSARDDRHAGRVAAGSREACRKPQRDRIAADHINDWNGRGRGLGRDCRVRSTDRSKQRHGPADEIGGQFRQAIKLPLCEAEFDGNILTHGKTLLAQSCKKGGDVPLRVIHCPAAEKSDHGCLLADRQLRPDHGAAQSNDESPPLHPVPSLIPSGNRPVAAGPAA